MRSGGAEVEYTDESPNDTIAGVAILLLVLTTIVLSATAFRGRRPAKELRRAIALWWGGAARRQKVFAIVAIGMGLCVSVVGILGSPLHAGLVQHAQTFYLVTDAGAKEISQEVFDNFRYSQFVLGVLGPAMAISGFLFVIYRALSFALARPDRMALIEIV